MRQAMCIFRKALLPALLLSALPALWSCRSVFVNGLRSVDHVQVSRAKVATAVLAHRAAPVVAIVGKRGLTLQDCKSLALAKNLDLRVAQFEEMAKEAIQQSNRKKLLPHLTFNGELGERDNYSYSYSDVIGQEGVNPSPAAGGTGVTNYSVGQERNKWRYSMELRWSLTDAALAYYLSRSSRNDRLRAHHQRVRVGQKLIGTVEAAFFRLLTLQERLPRAQRLVRLRKMVLRETHLLFREKMKSVEDFHSAKQNHLRASRILLGIEDALQRERNILATSLGLSPDTCTDGGFYAHGDLSRPSFHDKIPCLEMTAVQNRPEAYEAGLNHLNSVNDLKRTIVKFFPKVAAFWKFTRDKDKFWLNKDWKDIGLNIHVDLLDWLTNWDESRAARANRVKTDLEVGAVALGITSQVRFAALRYYRSLKEMDNAESSLEISKKLLDAAEVRAKGDALSQLDLIAAKAEVLQEELDRLKALGEANATLAELRAEMGINYRENLPPT
jgi:outer membrane protein TolC